MKRLIIAALFGICAASVQAADSQNTAPNADQNPKAAALLRAQYKNPTWLYDYDVPEDGKYSAKVFPKSIKPLGDNWFAVVTEHKSKRNNAPAMLILDWVHCGAQPTSVMSALVLLSPQGQAVKMADTHPAASPKDLDADTIRQIQAEDSSEPAHAKKMTDFVCKKAK